nr:uncharacterized protein LOC104120769 [Nicotiana tomentosiformis]
MNFHFASAFGKIQGIHSIRFRSKLYTQGFGDWTLLHQLRTVTLDHIYRVANGVADTLTKLGMLLTPSEGQLQWSLLHFLNAFNKDYSDVIVPRMVPLSKTITVLLLI